MIVAVGGVLVGFGGSLGFGFSGAYGVWRVQGVYTTGDHSMHPKP